MKISILLFLLSSCSLFLSGKEGPKTGKGTRYTIHFSSANWDFKNEKRSDYVFQHNKDGRIMLSNSFCDEFQDRPLEQLANKTFQSIKDFKPSKSTYTTFNDREAYRLDGSGSVDGVKVELKILNTRRDNCYFDFLAITPENSPKDETAFNEFLKTVRFK